jgi:hypothetical protein
LPRKGWRCPAAESLWENSHQQRKTAIARRSPTRPPPTVGDSATGCAVGQGLRARAAGRELCASRKSAYGLACEPDPSAPRLLSSVASKLPITASTMCSASLLVGSVTRMNDTPQRRCRWEFFLGNFPTVSYRNSGLEGVRLDVAARRLSSSTAKHCILLMLKAVEKGFNQIPLPAPELTLPCLTSSHNPRALSRARRGLSTVLGWAKSSPTRSRREGSKMYLQAFVPARFPCCLFTVVVALAASRYGACHRWALNVDEPLSLGVIPDASASMAPKLQEPRKALLS